MPLSHQLKECFQQLAAGDYSYRLPRTFAQDDEGEIIFSFNTVAEKLEKVTGTMQANELRLNNAVDSIPTALLEAGAGNLNVHVERDFRGDQVDVLAFLVDTTISELRVVVEENQSTNLPSKAEPEKICSGE